MNCITRASSNVQCGQRGDEKIPESLRDEKTRVADMYFESLGMIGFFVAGLGAGELSLEHSWNDSFSIPTLLGSAAILISLYHTYQFKKNGEINFPNILKVSLVSGILIGYNVLYFGPWGYKATHRY